MWLTKADNPQIAVTYISFIAVAGPAYVFCSYWVYHYVDLGFDASNEEEEELEENPHTSYDGRVIV